MFDFKKLLGDVRSEWRAKNEKVKEKERELAVLKSSPLPAEDVIAHIERRIDQRAAQFGPALEHTVKLLRSDPLGMDNIHHVGIITATMPGVQTSILSVETAILAIFADDIKAAIRKRVESMSKAGSAGPSLSKRSALIDKAEGELAKLISERDQLRREAAENGISL